MKELQLLKELSVLYVDDDKNACESLKHILQYYFKNTFIANNGIEALEIYDKNICHLLIVDYDMPLMNGYEFLSKVREKDKNISAFIISSYDDKEKLKNAIELNLLTYLVKPYELDQLKNILKKFVKHIQNTNSFKYFINEICYYDSIQKKIVVNNKEHKLTAFESKILEYLLENESKVIKYDELLNMLNTDNHKSLISIIYKINKKISFKIIQNIKDIGYRLKR